MSEISPDLSRPALRLAFLLFFSAFLFPVRANPTSGKISASITGLISAAPNVTANEGMIWHSAPQPFLPW